MSEPELIFHNSVPIEEENLPEARMKAQNQKLRILRVFELNPTSKFTPTQLHYLMTEVGFDKMLLTSVRRSITDLTKEGRLIKCDYSESRKGQYGTLNRTWKLNQEYVKPLNPQK
jgi:hypothetical protein